MRALLANQGNFNNYTNIVAKLLLVVEMCWLDGRVNLYAMFIIQYSTFWLIIQSNFNNYTNVVAKLLLVVEICWFGWQSKFICCVHPLYMQMSLKRDTLTGLNTLQYQVTGVVSLTVGEAPVKFVSIELHCDYDKTPFCDHL